MLKIVPPQIVDNPASLDLYANFLWLKYFFANGCVYDYNHHKLALKTGKSHRFIKRTVEYALKKGWCLMHGENLIFKNRHKQNFSKFKNTFVVKGETIPEIKLELKRLAITNKLRRCAYVNKIRSDKQFPKKLTDLKKAIKRERKISYRSVKGEKNDKLQISYKGIGKVLGCGEAMAFRTIDKLCKNRQIKKQRNSTLLYERVTLDFFKCFIQGIQTSSRYFFKKGNIYRTEMNSYSF